MDVADGRCNEEPVLPIIGTIGARLESSVGWPADVGRPRRSPRGGARPSRFRQESVRCATELSRMLKNFRKPVDFESMHEPPLIAEGATGRWSFPRLS